MSAEWDTSNKLSSQFDELQLKSPFSQASGEPSFRASEGDHVQQSHNPGGDYSQSSTFGYSRAAWSGGEQSETVSPQLSNRPPFNFNRY